MKAHNRRLVLALLAAGAGLVSNSHGQSALYAEYEGQMRRVVAMDGRFPIIEIGMDRKKLEEVAPSIGKVKSYTDGTIEVIDKDAVLIEDYSTHYSGYLLRFEAYVEADRDFENCFLLVGLKPEDGTDLFLLHEVEDIVASGTHTISLTMPVSPIYAAATYTYKVFSNGEQIEALDAYPEGLVRSSDMDSPRDVASADPGGQGDGSAAGGEDDPAEGGAGAEEEANEEPVARSQPRTFDDSQAAIPARIVKTKMPDFPVELVGKNVAGMARLVFTIGPDGQVREIIQMQADHVAFLPEARKSILESRYQPAYYEGQPLLTTVAQTFTFNEFVSFAEGIEMLRYPNLEDRSPLLVYGTRPAILDKVSESGEAVSFQLELTVDALGRPREIEVTDSNDEVVANAVAEAVADWVYLPGIKDGEPVAMRIEVPFSVGRR